MSFLLLVLLLATQAEAPVEAKFPLSKNETRTIDAINVYRAKHKLPPLKMDPILMKVARHRVPVYSHNAYGCASWDEAKRCGFVGPVSDNLAKGQQSPQETVDSWASSNGHARQMRGQMNMNARWVDYRFDHVGVAHSGNNWIAVFGRKDKK